MDLVDSLASDFIRLFSLLPAHRHSSGRPFTCCITFVFGMVRDSVPPVAARVRQPFSGFLPAFPGTPIMKPWKAFSETDKNSEIHANYSLYIHVVHNVYISAYLHGPTCNT